MSDPLQDIMQERARQDAKWGERNHPDLYWLGIISEEVGEVAKAIIEGKDESVREELTQVAAVAIAWLECLSRRSPENREYVDPCPACDGDGILEADNEDGYRECGLCDGTGFEGRP